MWALIWDNAPWRLSREVMRWLREHNRAVGRSAQGVRILACPLPVKSPWLNPLEVHWCHAKRQTAEPGAVLTGADTEARICQYDGCPGEPPLALPEKAA